MEEKNLFTVQCARNFPEMLNDSEVHDYTLLFI